MIEPSQALINFLRQRSNARDRLLGLLRNIDGISVNTSPLSVSISWHRGRAVLTSLPETVNKVAEDLGEMIILVIDEVRNWGALGLNIPMLLTYIYDN
ncbi:ATPase [Vulcanisaeta moutnovskia 768-28]|uniref:ATPase n=1 Tax=Vulcanisaeta moutnovskia (strain 768-28) TaxID=985053 RepID=F0QSS7_VULM7|nr:ATPase [Vulcanisaeta moutnovskia]ADY01594.1 ATPase [Vulcanisaeta moutnovskia 768-28]